MRLLPAYKVNNVTSFPFHTLLFCLLAVIIIVRVLFAYWWIEIVNFCISLIPLF